MKKFTFKGGIHPDDNKDLSAGKHSETLPLPETVFIPLSQHAGAPAEAAVKPGDTVRTGQKIGEAAGFISAPVHSSVSGTVEAIVRHPHPTSGYSDAVRIKREGDDWDASCRGRGSLSNVSGEEIKDIVKNAGIVGMGGASFPAHVKLSPPEHAKIDTLIINGAECEPYITADYRLMIESASGIIEGIKLLMRALGVRRCFIGIEDNKPLCIKMLEEKARKESGISVAVLAVKYPQGGEKQLIKAVLGRTVPSGKLPLDAGVVVHNVGTALAVKEAVADGRPLIERMVTVSGEGIREPGNLRVRIGTPFKNLVEHCGGFKDGCVKLIAGGPMMGVSQYSLETPVVKGTSALIGLLNGGARENAQYECIRCGKCVEVCPVFLVPSDLARYSRREMWTEAADSGLNDCMECGSCSYVCPSGIPIVHYIKDAKYNCRRVNSG